MEEAKTPAIIVDIDGTVSLRCREHGQSDPTKGNDHVRGIHDYHRVNEDQDHLPIIKLVKAYQNTHPDVTTLFTSGRPDSCSADTYKWLTDRGLRVDMLIMRKAGDYRHDYIVKEELYREYIESFFNVEFAIDDRQQVVDMWRNIGLVCLQVAPGNF